jgi:hypothetical protein
MTFKCTAKNCIRVQSVDTLYSLLPTDKFEVVSMALNKKLLQADFSSDLMACPNPTCNSFGFANAKTCGVDY